MCVCLFTTRLAGGLREFFISTFATGTSSVFWTLVNPWLHWLNRFEEIIKTLFFFFHKYIIHKMRKSPVAIGDSLGGKLCFFYFKKNKFGSAISTSLNLYSISSTHASQELASRYHTDRKQPVR